MTDFYLQGRDSSLLVGIRVVQKSASGPQIGRGCRRIWWQVVGARPWLIGFEELRSQYCTAPWFPKHRPEIWFSLLILKEFLINLKLTSDVKRWALHRKIRSMIVSTSCRLSFCCAMMSALVPTLMSCLQEMSWYSLMVWSAWLMTDTWN